ncbi:MFS transporter [Catenulispora yoronensis]|uniref:MFS transporter n=1 Tax=Catenulispora yoronensis TaxID=450799 RepID=A0ABN2VMB2_9ACTN
MQPQARTQIETGTRTQIRTGPGTQPQTGTHRPGAVIFVLCLAGFMAMLDVFVVNVAFPAIGDSFHSASLADLSWVLNAYTIVYAALLVPAGRFADRHGRKRAFQVGLTVFTTASLACAAAPGLWWLVAARVVQAAGAAALTTASLGLLLTVLPADRRAGAVKIWATSSSVAAALGPVVGGAVVLVSWQCVFLLNLPVGVVALVAARRLVPDLHDPRAARATSVDAVAVVALTAAIAAAALGLVKGGDWGWQGPATLTAFAVAAVAAAVFAVRTKRHPAPVIDVALLRVPSFVWANVTVLLFCTAFSALFLSVVLWMQDGAGYSAIATGLAILPGPVSVPLFAALAQRLVRRISAGTVIALGNLVFAAGALLLAACASADVHYWPQVLPGWVLTGIGIGLALPTMMAAATAALPPERAGTGSAMVNTGRQLGYVLGVAVFVAIIGTLGAAKPGAAPHTAFQHGWWFVAGVAALSAVTGLGVSRRD